MQAVWHGEMQLITDLDRVFDQGENENIDIIKQEVRQYEKEIKERRNNCKPRADEGRKRENKGQEKVG